MNRARLSLVATLLALALAVAPSTAQPMWAPGGVLLCQNGCPGDVPQIVADGAGGAFVGWRDIRDYSTNDEDVYMQHITGMGVFAPGWPVDALPVAALPNVQEFTGLAPDGLGGALVAWEEWRNGAVTGIDPYVQRVLADGSLPASWAIGGNPASRDAAHQRVPQVGPDGVGGAYVVWQDERDYAVTNYDIYGQHLTPGGAVAPGWPQNGLAVCALPGEQGGPYFALPDDSGGALFEWGDGRPGAPGSYALRVHADGTLAVGWPANGLLLNSRGNLDVIRDEAGGFFAVSPTTGSVLGFDGAYYLQRFTFDGTPAAGWPADGVLVCNAPGIRSGVRLASDGAGGVQLCWYDYRPPYDLTGGEIFALRVRSDGTLAPGWTVNGTLLSDPADGYQSYAPFAVRDGQGGEYVVWQSQGGISDFPSTIQHLTGSGQVAAGWPRYGLRVAPSGHQLGTRIATDGQGGAIVAWDEGCCGRDGVWAQRFGPDGVVPVLLSLVSAAAIEGRVELDWYAAAGVGLEATAYRRMEHTNWEALGSVSADGTGHLRYGDRAVSPGERYAYRLGYLEGGAQRFTAETWVEVPGLVLALEGLRPNPAVGELVASFTLPSGAPARLQLLDVTGRVWLAREVGGLGAGSHLVRLTDAARVPAGMYWLRLTQTGRSLLARAAVVR